MPGHVSFDKGRAKIHRLACGMIFASNTCTDLQGAGACTCACVRITTRRSYSRVEGLQGVTECPATFHLTKGGLGYIGWHVTQGDFDS
jgi:hypothetical protein